VSLLALWARINWRLEVGAVGPGPHTLWSAKTWALDLPPQCIIVFVNGKQAAKKLILKTKETAPDKLDGDSTLLKK